MHSHVRFLGLLFILYSLLGLIAAFAIFAFFTGFGVLTTGDLTTLPFFSLLGALAAAGFAIAALPGIITGLGLRAHKNWSRYLAVILGVLNLVNVPFGTILGIYTIWVLLHDDTPKVFRRPRRRPSPQRRRRASA